MTGSIFDQAMPGAHEGMEIAAVALLCGNRLEFAAVRFALHRIGARITPISRQLSPQEISYIVDNSEAEVLFADVRVAAQCRFCPAVAANAGR